MKYSVILLLGALLGSGYLHAQEKTKLYYDENGKGLDTKKKAVFYRMVTFNNEGNAIGTVEDFYLNDKPLRKGEALVIDKFNDNNSRWKGEVLNYNEKGKLQKKSNYDSNGNLDGIQTEFDNEVKVNEVDYSHGNPVKDYYLVFDKKGKTTKYSILTRLPMTLSTSDKNIVPFTEKKVIYQDGQAVQFYFLDGLSVAVKVSTKQLYGSYYEAYVTIENGSNPQFDFDPSNITASLIKDGDASAGEVLSYDEYMKKVKRRQGWTAAFSAFAEVAAATSAGYSSSSSNTYAHTSSGKSVAVHTTTTSYDAGAQYAATQNAANNMGQLSNQQYDIKKTISEGYLKMNTIFPNSRLVGFVNIKLQDADHILLNVPVNGKLYHFEL